MFQDIGRVLMVAIRPRVLRLLRVGVTLLRVGVIPRRRDLQLLRVVVAPLHVGAVLPVAASAAPQFLPWRLWICARGGRMDGVENWFVVMRPKKGKYQDNRKPAAEGTTS